MHFAAFDLEVKYSQHTRLTKEGCMIHHDFNGARVRMPDDGETVALEGGIYDDDAFLSWATLGREGSQGLIDTAFESVSFSIFQNGRPVGAEFIIRMLDKVCQSIQRTREAA